MEEPIDLREPGGPICDDGAIEILVHALGAHPLTGTGTAIDGAPAGVAVPAAEPQPPAFNGSVVPAHGSVGMQDSRAESSAGDTAVDPPSDSPALKCLDSLPRVVRRRLDVYFGEGEQVECAILGQKRGQARWVLATTHRIMVAPPEPREPGTAALTLPYHRTTASVSEEGTIELRSNEFDRTRIAAIDPEAGYAAETSHLLARIADA